MPAKNKNFHETSPDKHVSNAVKKKRPQARNNTVSDKKQKPKSKNAEKKKLAKKRQQEREENTFILRKDRKRELLALDPITPNTTEAPEKAPLEPKPEFSKSDLDRREECWRSIEVAETFTREELLQESLIIFEKSLTNTMVEVSDSFGMRRELTKLTFETLFYFEEIPEKRCMPSRSFFLKVAEKILCAKNKNLHLRRMFYPESKRKGKKRASLVLAEQLITNESVRVLKRRMIREISFERWVSHVAENPRYTFVKPYAQAMQAVEKYDAKSYSSPEDRRHFILDIGPTNSGKTYSGMQNLIAANSGVYLGPLRLLAMEVAEEINLNGVPCTLLTGEEHRQVEGARHVASTVEMLDRNTRYEVAVIDECQMITDPERGYAWASAIVSVNAEIVHLCLAPEAENLVCKILDGLGEEYEIRYHDRLVPLKASKAIRYPKDIRQGDAVVVFSRKAVQEYSAFLESRGIRTSMVYGALPYEVRREEVRKFMDGETQVVVATDAIGMGLNLPVQRVVFAEVEKFDGHQKRMLTASEIKQIAGRAGRYGKYEIGYATATDPKSAEIVATALNMEIEQSSEIRMDMPHKIIEFDLPLSMLMRAWQRGKLPYPYIKRDLSQMIELARRVEDLDNEFVADAIEIPFKSGDRFLSLDDMWEKAVRRAYMGLDPDFELYDVTIHDRLQYMEDAAKVADLAYGLAKRYGTVFDLKQIDENRRIISEVMIAKMSQTPVRICSWCGKPLAQDSRYDMHSMCYREYKREQSLNRLVLTERGYGFAMC